MERAMKGYRLALACVVMLFAATMLGMQHEVAWAVNTADVAAQPVSEKQMVESESYYLKYNPSAPKLAKSDVTSPNQKFEFLREGTHDGNSCLYYKTKTAASGNASAGASLSVVYRSIGWMRTANDPNWMSDLLDLRITYVVTKSDRNPVYVHGEDYCRIDLALDYRNGTTTNNLPEFEMQVEFLDHATGRKLDLNGAIWTLGQSLDEGEGFMVKGARAGFVSNDAPITNPDSGKVNGKVSADSRWHTIPGSTLYEAGALGSGWYGFVGGPCVYSADTTNWLQARNIQLENDMFWQRNHGFNYIDTNRTDTSEAYKDTEDKNGSWKYLDGTKVNNTFHWRSAAVECELKGGTLVLKQLAVSKGNSSPAAANDEFGLGSAGMGQDRSWAYRGANERAEGLETWGCYGFKWFVQLFAPQTVFVPNSPTKAVDKETAQVGETVTYTIKQKVNEHGVDCAEGYVYQALVFDDVLPEGLAYQSFSIKDPSGADITSSGGSLTVGSDKRTVKYSFDKKYLQGKLDYNGGDFTVVITAKVLPQAQGTTLVNQGKFTFNETYERATNEVKTVVPGIPVPPPAKKVDKEMADVGDVVTYTVDEQIVAVESSEYHYDNMVFTDKLPDGLSFKSLKVLQDGSADITAKAGKSSASGRTVTYTFAKDYLAKQLGYKGQTISFVIEATVDEKAAGSTVENSAVVRINDADLQTNVVKTKIPKPKVKKPEKTVDKRVAYPGQELTYTITQGINKRGDDVSATYCYKSLSFLDELPANLTFKSLTVLDTTGADVTAKAGEASQEGRAISYTFNADYLEKTLAYDGGRVAFVVKATVDAAAAAKSLVNSATVSVNNAPENTNEVVTLVPGTPVKSVDKQKASPGESLTYKIIQPVGKWPEGFRLSALSFEDVLPKGFVYESLTVLDTKGADVTSNAGSVKASGQKVTYAFAKTFLEKGLAYDGGCIVFIVNGHVDDGDPSEYGNLLVNDAKLTFDGEYSVRTNKVETRVPDKLVPLPLTGEEGIRALLIVGLSCTMVGAAGIAVRRGRTRSDEGGE